MRAVVAILLALLSFGASADTNDRLVALGRVWGMVKFAHPALGYRDIDWDAAGTRAVGRVVAGGNISAYADAVAEMLATLGDVRHADGRQLQRVGIIPDIEVYPTIDGLRQRKDEVLDRAVAYLSQ